MLIGVTSAQIYHVTSQTKLCVKVFVHLFSRSVDALSYYTPYLIGGRHTLTPIHQLLATKVQADKISADYEAGVLTLSLPKAEEVKPKRIAIHAGKTGKMIEGKVRNIAGNKN
jgi:Hsp20/alpha crystallin family